MAIKKIHIELDSEPCADTNLLITGTGGKRTELTFDSSGKIITNEEVNPATVAAMTKKISHLRMVIAYMGTTILRNPMIGPYLQNELESYRNCKNLEDFEKWFKVLIEYIITNTDSMEADGIPINRAVCPLCGSRPKFFVGYALPQGLKVHLSTHFDTAPGENTIYSHSECMVINAVKQLMLNQFFLIGE